ncbi:MAG: response regulator [Treponema sp.]|nr:response regulator [Treponema sp.]
MNFLRFFKNYFFNEKYNLQHRLLNVLILVGMIGGTLASITSVILGFSILSIILSICILGFCFLGLLIANTFGHPQLSVIILSLAVNNLIMPLLYITSGGIKSGMPLWITLGLVFTLLLLDGVKCWVVFSINCIGELAVIIYSILHPEIVWQPYNEIYIYIDILVATLTLVLTLAAIFKYNSYTYRKQEKDLIEAMIETQRATKAKSDFLSNMSHDIRTPMNAIIGFTEIAKKNLDDRKKLFDCISKITLSSEHLLNLINDVLDMTKIESGKVTFEEETFNLRTIINDIQDMMMQTLLEKKMHLHIDTTQLIDETVSCDRLRLNQVLINLVGNAIKYSNPDGNIWLSAIQLPDDNENEILVEIHVKDDGLGMSKEFVEKVFQPFEREYNSTKSGISGTGLGLTITKSIVEMMRGTISVTSELGIGSEFVITIPFDVPTLLEIEDEDDLAIKNFDFSKKRVLLVEDNAFNREIAVELLTDAGLEVEEANDGSIAVEILKNNPAGYYDAVIMDLQMPVMDGYEATRIIRSFEDIRIATIPIVAMTANAFSEDKKKALDCGMNAYLTKPINIKDLLKVMNLILQEGLRRN